MRSKPSSAFAIVQPWLSCPNHVLLRHADIVEEGFAELLMTAERLDRPARDARRREIDEQEGNALLLLGGLVGAHEQEDPVRVLRERRPCLLAVYDPVVAVEHGFAAQGREIGAGIRLRIALAPHVLAGEDARQVCLLLLLGAEADQQRPEHDDAHVRRARHAGAVEFLDEGDLLAGRQAHAAIFFRPRRGEPSPLRELDAPGLDLVPVHAAWKVHQFRRAVLRDEIANHRAEGRIVHRFVIVLRRRDGDVHGGTSYCDRAMQYRLIFHMRSHHARSRLNALREGADVLSTIPSETRRNPQDEVSGVRRPSTALMRETRLTPRIS